MPTSRADFEALIRQLTLSQQQRREREKNALLQKRLATQDSLSNLHRDRMYQLSQNRYNLQKEQADAGTRTLKINAEGLLVSINPLTGESILVLDAEKKPVKALRDFKYKTVPVPGQGSVVYKVGLDGKLEPLIQADKSVVVETTGGEESKKTAKETILGMKPDGIQTIGTEKTVTKPTTVAKTIEDGQVTSTARTTGGTTTTTKQSNVQKQIDTLLRQIGEIKKSLLGYTKMDAAEQKVHNDLIKSLQTLVTRLMKSMDVETPILKTGGGPPQTSPSTQDTTQSQTSDDLMEKYGKTQFTD